MEPRLAYSSDEQEFGLLRLVVINSYMKRQARVVCVDHHTHVSGRNGRGKTTLLRLIPLFYGEQPSKMVKPSGEVLRSIRDYLFDSLSSYLVFEYRSPDGIKLAIMYYGNADSPTYLLCDGPYESKLFLEEGRFVEGRPLKGRLASFGRNPSNMLGVMEYQAVIQGRSLQGRNDVRVLARRFALAEKGNLAGIEKIASAMFFKDITFTALKRMAYSVSSDRSDQVLGMSMTEKMLSQFFLNFKAYQNVMKHAQAFIDGVDAHLRVAQLSRERKALSIKSNLLSRYLQTEIGVTEAELERIRNAFHEVNQRLIDQKQDLQSRRSEVAADLQSCSNVIKRVDREERDYLARDIPSLRNLVATIATMEQHIENRLEMLRVLRSKSDDILGKYGQQEAAVHSQYDQRIKPLYERRDQVTLQCRSAQERIGEERAQAIEQHERLRGEQMEAIEARLGQARQALEQARLEHAGLREAEEFAARRDDYKATEQSLREELDGLLHEARQRGDTINTLKLQWAGLDADFTAASRALAEKREHLRHLLALESPADGTVLRYLREEMPGWYENIGRVVREDVLLRGDLNPAAAPGDASTLYGLSLDLDRIESGLAGREEALAEQIALAREAVAQEQEQVNGVEARMAKLMKQSQELSDEQAVADRKATGRRTAIEECKAAAAANERAAREELEQRRQAHDIRIREAQSGVDLVSAERTEVKAELERCAAGIKAQYDRLLAEARQQEQASLAAIKAELDAAAQDKDATLRRLRDSCEQELREGGVNVAGLRAIEHQVNAEKETLERARGARADVEKYERWLTLGPPERSEASSRAQELQLKLSDLDGAIARADAQAETTNRLLRERQNNQEARLQTLTERRRLVDEFRRTHSTETDGYELAEPFEPVGATLEGIATAFARASAQMLQLRNERNQKIQPIHSLFIRAEPESHVGQVSKGLPAVYADSDENNTVAEILDVLKRWYDSGHVQSRDSLNGECRAACELFKTYLGKLQGFQADMLKLSRQLQNSLDTEMVFDAIRRVSIRLSGKVERVPYWSHLNDLAVEFKRWEEIDCVGIPPQSLITQLAGLAAHIPGGRIEELPENLIDMEIIVDDGTEKSISNENELKNASSNGLSSMILCMIFVAFVNRVRKDERVWLTWALDEIGTIDAGNSKALLDMLDLHRIRLISASPEGRESTLAMFKNHYEIQPNFEIQRCVPAPRRRHVG